MISFIALCACQVLHIVDFLRSRRMETASTSIEVFYVQLKVSQTSHLIYVFLWAPRHDIAARCPSVNGTLQSQAVTHPIMNRALRCLTSVIEPTPMRQRRIPYDLWPLKSIPRSTYYFNTTTMFGKMLFLPLIISCPIQLPENVVISKLRCTYSNKHF